MLTSYRRVLWVAVLCSAACARTSSTPVINPAHTKAESAASPSVPNVSQDPVVQRIVELGHTDSQVSAHLRHLTEHIGPRLTSSHGLMEAEAWARDQFAEWGLQARLEPWGTMDVGFDRGPQSGGQVAPLQLEYVFTTPAWSPGVHGPHRAGAVLYPLSEKEIAKDPQRFAGAWVVRPKWPPALAPSRAQRKAIDKALAEVKAAGVVSQGRDKRGELVHTSGRSSIKWEQLPSLVQVRMRGDQHTALVEQLSAGAEVELSFSVDNRFFRGPVVLNNVVADIVGSEKPDEFVIVGGHIDSWDGATGAVDNGTGVATTMEAARLLITAGAKPKRTIRFMLWSGEEQGLLGSRGYVKQHPEVVANTSAVLVHDGGTNYLSGLWVTPEMMADMKQVFEPVTKLNPEMPFVLAPTAALRAGGSDHSPFIRAGAPGFFWMQSGRSNYRCHHHTQLDTLPAAIPEYQEHSALVVAIAAYNLANLDHMLDRTNSRALARRDSGVDMDGMKIKAITPKSKAAKAGLKVGDEILAVDGKEVGSLGQLYRAVVSGAPTKVFKIRRGKRTKAVKINLEDAEVTQERARRLADRTAKYGAEALKPSEAVLKATETEFGRDESCLQ